jgi:hypothetical protein
VTRAISAINQRPSLDGLLQTPGTWQRPDATPDKSLFEVFNDALPMKALNLVIDGTLIPRQC